MIVATIVERFYGSAITFGYFYHSPWMIALWIITAVTSLMYIIKRHNLLSKATFLIHVALLMILAGAAVTFLTAERGKITLRLGEGSTEQFRSAEGDEICNLPFSVSLNDCGIEYYKGTSSPSDYFSEVEIIDNGSTFTERISMNKVLDIRGYRFYQTALGDGYSVLSVSHDPWGIGISYTGYVFLALTMIAFFFSKKSRFRELIRKSSLLALLLFVTLPAIASEGGKDMPKALQRPLAKSFGMLYVYHNGRIVPMQTLARDFCLKIYGKDSYRGLTAEQVLTGWIFYYDDWKCQPMIKIKGEKVRQALGIRGKYASILDFYNRDGYKLNHDSGTDLSNRDMLSADEKASFISLVCTGKALKIIPIHKAYGNVEWQSWVDVSPSSPDGALEIGMEMEHLARAISHGKYNEANQVILSIRDGQTALAGEGNLPSSLNFSAEMLYNRLSYPLLAASVIIMAGFLAFVAYCRTIIGAKASRVNSWLRVITIAVAVAGLIYLTVMMTLRWIIGGHLPISNGAETMQAMAWISLLISLVMVKRFPIIHPAGLLVGGFALMVAMLSDVNPVVTNLIPVLSSPLLSLHVMTIMTSYAVFAIMMLNSLTALIIGQRRPAYAQLADVSEILLYPGVFLLGIGIFIGAVWANQSWGRYWGWDPKETWALITFFVYALPLHVLSFPQFHKAKIRHFYFLIAFMFVLITYFGVNYFLSGLHSYA